MLKQFKVPDDIAVRVPGDVVRSAVEDIFTRLGMPDDDAHAQPTPCSTPTSAASTPTASPT